MQDLVTRRLLRPVAPVAMRVLGQVQATASGRHPGAIRQARVLLALEEVPLVPGRLRQLLSTDAGAAGSGAAAAVVGVGAAAVGGTGTGDASRPGQTNSSDGGLANTINADLYDNSL